MTQKGRRRETRDTYIQRLIDSGDEPRHVDQRVVAFMSKVMIGRTKHVVNIGGTYRQLRSALKDYCLAGEWIAGDTLRLRGGHNIQTLAFPKQRYSDHLFDLEYCATVSRFIGRFVDMN